MKVLGIDTSTLMTTCAVMEDERLLGEFSLSLDMSHSEALVPMIQQLMDNLKLKISDMDLFAVAAGPGSFTGLRIGLATAKSFAHVTRKPIVGVSSLETLAMALPYQPIVAAMMDARRDRVFTGVYRMGKYPEELLSPDAIPVVELIEHLEGLDGNIVLVGDGAVTYADIFKSRLGNKAVFAPGHLNLSSASAVCRLGLKKYDEGNTEDLFVMAPEYLRDSQAQRILMDKR